MQQQTSLLVMKTKIFISTILILMLFGCKVSMQPGSEIINTSITVVLQDEKSIWLIYRDSFDNNYEDANGIHKIKYSTYHILKKRKIITEYYNLKGNYLDHNSVLEYGKTKELWKKDKLLEQSFMDSTNHLIQPSYFNFAKMKQKYYKDGSWLVKYYNSNNQPSCNNGVIQQRIIWDTIWQVNKLDTNYILGTKMLDYKKCKLE